MSYTYRILLDDLKQFSELQLDLDVTIKAQGQFFRAGLDFVIGIDDVLDDKHPIIASNDEEPH